MTRMPFTWVSEPESKPRGLGPVLLVAMILATLTFCALMLLR
jgi:hypothetical protein